MSRRQSGQTLIIIAAVIMMMGGGGVAVGEFLTGKPVSELRKEALAMVQDKPRCESLAAAFKRWEKEIERIDGLHGKNRKAMLELLRRRDASPADFDRLFASADALSAQAHAAALDMRFAVREQLSAEQWSSLFAKNQMKK